VVQFDLDAEDFLLAAFDAGALFFDGR